MDAIMREYGDTFLAGIYGGFIIAVLIQVFHYVTGF